MNLHIERTQKAKSKQKLGKNKCQSSHNRCGTKNTDFINWSCSSNMSQSHIYIPHPFNGKRAYNWSEKDLVVEKAVIKAIEHLYNAFNDSMIQNYQIIKDAIIEIISVLNNPMLKFYPFFGQSDGLAMEHKEEISIRTTLISKAIKDNEAFYRLQKTLIHEAFHIIGGCVKGRAQDSICLENVKKEEALQKIISKDNIQEMEADDFAHFVMMC